MALPITLSPGEVAIYGTGFTGTTINGVIVQDNFRIGTVYHIWSGGAAAVYGGQVIFEEGKQRCRIATATGTWTIINYGQLAISPTEALP